jgi:hypothetical protein
MFKRGSSVIDFSTNAEGRTTTIGDSLKRTRPGPTAGCQLLVSAASRQLPVLHSELLEQNANTSTSWFIVSVSAVPKPCPLSQLVRSRMGLRCRVDRKSR